MLVHRCLVGSLRRGWSARDGEPSQDGPKREEGNETPHRPEDITLGEPLSARGRGEVAAFLLGVGAGERWL